MFHLLKEATVLTPQAVVLALGAFKFQVGMSQLALSVATSFDRRFKIFDVIGSYIRQIGAPPK